jgi:hypothetical protein
MWKIIFIYILLYSPNTLLAAEKSMKEESWLDYLTPLRHTVIKNYHSLLKKIDNALCANEDLNNSSLEKIIYKNNLQLITSIKYHDRALIPYLYIRGNIILPKTNRRFEITINKQTESKLLNQKLDTQHHSAIEDEKIHLGFKYNLVKKEYLNFYAKLGTRINDIGDIYAKIGVVKYLNFRYFMLFLDAKLYQYLLDNQRIISPSARFIKPLNEAFIFEKDIVATWKKEEKTTTLDFIAKLYQHIDTKHDLEYWLSYTAEDNTLSHYGPKAYVAHLKYRYRLKKWAYVEVIPQLKKEKENHFATQRSIRVNFALIFSRWL